MPPAAAQGAMVHKTLPGAPILPDPLGRHTTTRTSPITHSIDQAKLSPGPRVRPVVGRLARGPDLRRVIAAEMGKW